MKSLIFRLISSDLEVKYVYGNKSTRVESIDGY